MLNDLYTCFDRVLDVHDVYKVSSLPYFLTLILKVHSSLGQNFMCHR